MLPDWASPQPRHVAAIAVWGDFSLAEAIAIADRANDINANAGTPVPQDALNALTGSDLSRSLAAYEGSMRATPSLANTIVGVIAASVFVARLIATHMFVPTTEAAGPLTVESSHAHKADRLLLFQPVGPSVTTTAPVRPRDASGVNTTVVAKNVVVHPMNAAAKSFDNTGLARDARTVSVVVIRPEGLPAGDWNHNSQRPRFADRRVAAKRDGSENTVRAAPKHSQ
jgi:hypothetical protein